MAGRVARAKMTRAEAILFAEETGGSLTVFEVRGQYHFISTSLEHLISPVANVIYKTQQEGVKVFRYNEGDGYVREETVDKQGVVSIRRYRSKSKGKIESIRTRYRRDGA